MQKSFSADNFDITGRTNLNNTQNINGNTLGNIVNNTLAETKGYHSLSNMMDSNNYYNPIEQALQMDIASVLSPKPLGNDANSYQIAQNTTPNTVSDVDILSIQNSLIKAENLTGKLSTTFSKVMSIPETWLCNTPIGNTGIFFPSLLSL